MSGVPFDSKSALALWFCAPASWHSFLAIVERPRRLVPGCTRSCKGTELGDLRATWPVKSGGWAGNTHDAAKRNLRGILENVDQATLGMHREFEKLRGDTNQPPRQV